MFQVDQANAPVRYPDRFFIGGEWVVPSTAATITVVAPATERVYMRVAEAMPADVDRAVEAARAAFDHGPWPRMTHLERGDYLRALSRALSERIDDLALIWPNEMGVTHSLACARMEGLPAIYSYYAGLAETFAFEEVRSSAVAPVGILVREPVGVVGAIIPWNGPSSLIAYKLAPALLAGCTVVIKASPEAPGQALVVAEAVEAAGFPPGVVNVITADRQASEALVHNPGIDKIAFTGSSVAGRSIAAAVGGRMGRYTLELGGKSAGIVLDDYDIERAAKTIGERAGMMTGQVCASLTRIIVPRGRHDQMLEALAAEFGSTRVGDPFEAGVQMGPVATGRQRDRIEGYIAGARADGFTLATGGGRPRSLDRGFFVEPTVFGNVENASRLAQEEVFGPVLAVIPADDEEQAIAIANDSPYGLSGAVFTNDVERAYSVARAVRTGTMGQNAMRLDFSIAFGGFKQSGVGREGGVEGLLPYLETKTLLLNGIPANLGQ